MATRSIASSRFKAHCLRLLDEVAETRQALVITKRGKPVARLVPLDGPEPDSLLGSVSWDHDADVLAPVEDAWSATEE